jgi:xanthine dehydrogenase accessory factor
MKEIKDIIKSFEKANNEGKRTALATVVKVEGSSYRRPGARMLICEDGQLTGAISGGCLEGDALRKALLAIQQQENKLVTYDSTDEDDAKFGVQLGCNGIVYILFEPIDNKNVLHQIALLKLLAEKRESAVLSTLFSLTDKHQPGTQLLYRKDDLHTNLPLNIKEQLISYAAEVLENKSSVIKTHGENGQTLSILFDYINPPIAIILAGAGNDVQPLVEIASVLGWQITVTDGRPAHATTARFPKADRILVSRPEALLQQIEIDEQTAFVLMSHNYNYDLVMLDYLLREKVSYIGVLGPKKKLSRMTLELQIDKDRDLSHIHGPIGLDIGAETAEEIAISIVSEIKAILSGRSGNTLKDKLTGIHMPAVKLDS